METRVLKITILLAIAFTFGQVVKADTRVLRNIEIYMQRSYSKETISLENDKDLAVKGYYVQNYAIADDLAHVLTATINYVGDKNGYRAKYTLMFEDAPPAIKRLNPGSLKSLGG